MKEKERKIKQKSHITLHTSQNKGITLVALIITIIVLLILAVVAIRAVQGDGIITKAKEAKSKTTVAQEQEQILLAVNEWKIQKNYQNEPGSFKSFMKDKLSDVATIPDSDPDAGPLTVTFTKTGNAYTVTKEGEITEAKAENPGGEGGNSGESGEAISILEQYLFGDSTDGKSYITALSEDGQNYKENKDLGIVEGDIKGLNNVLLGNECIFYIEYEGAKYKFKTGFDGDMPTNTIPSYGVKRIDNWSAESRVGKYVKDENNNIWRIIYDDETHGLQMISANTYKYNDSNFYLGNNDTLITDWTKLNKETKEFELADLNGNKLLDDNLEKTIYSYNQAVETLNTACENLFKENGNYTKTYIQDVRSVGSNPIFENKDNENNTPYTSQDGTYLKIWPKNTAGLCDGKGYSTDNNFETDFDRMIALGINKSDTDYWLACRVVSVLSDDVDFSMRCVDSDGSYSNGHLWDVSESNAYGAYDSKLLRPVVSLSSGILDSATQSGTIDNPIILQ